MAKQELTLVVLAAGMGSRFGGPKQIEAVGPSGEIILDYSVFDALRAGFSRIVFVVRDDVEAVLRRRLAPALTGRCSTAFVTQRLDDALSPELVPPTRVKPWGTAHAVLACREVVPGPFVAVNADDFYGADAFRRIASFLSEARGPASGRNALVGYSLAATLTKHGTVSRGVCEVDGAGRLTSIVECHGVGMRKDEIGYESAGIWRAIPGDAVASMNFWGLDPSVFSLLKDEFAAFLATHPDDKEEYRLPTAIGRLMDRGKIGVRVLRTDSAWLGVTHREDLVWVREAIRARVAAGEYPSPLWGGSGSHG